MRVLLLGATGTIGGAILAELLHHGYSVLALARSDSAEQKIINMGADVIRGDLHKPRQWASVIHKVDAVIHAAATFCENMGEIDLRVINELIAEGNKAKCKIRFIYTGGVWLYGQTGDDVATEATSLNPISSFAWMEHNGEVALSAPCFYTNIVHPGIVYARDAGVLSDFSADEGRVEVWGAIETRWPVVHRDDLASAYRLVLEKGIPGESYNVCSEQGVKVGDIAAEFTKRFKCEKEPLILTVEEVIAEHGEWALGPMLDQCMSAEKIKKSLGWLPYHRDIMSEIN